MDKQNNIGCSSFILFILMLLVLILIMGSCGASGRDSKVITGSSLERTIESHGYNVKSLIKSDDSRKYYAYVNGKTAVIDDNFSSIQVRVYDNDNILIDAFEISK